MTPKFVSQKAEPAASRNEALNDGDLVSRYFERVLGVRQVQEIASDGESSAALPDHGVCLLIEIGNNSDTRSIQEMGARLLDAVRNEWLKKSIDHLPEIEWLRADEASWKDAIEDQGLRLKLAIVCGAQVSITPDPRIVFVSSFAEMNGSHVLKRDSWRAMQQKISVANADRP